MLQSIQINLKFQKCLKRSNARRNIFLKKKFSSYIFIHFFFPIFPDVSSLRLDFESFNLLAGSTTVEGDPGFGCQDEFNVNGLGTAQRIPIICGSNNGHHSKKTPTFFLTFTHHLDLIRMTGRDFRGTSVPTANV